MCQLMKTSVLIFLLLQCSHGITVKLTNFAKLVVLTLQLSLTSTVQSTETAISLVTSIDTIMPSITFPIETSLMVFTDIITTPVVSPADIITQTVLFTTDISTVNITFTPTTDVIVVPSTSFSANTGIESIIMVDSTTLFLTVSESITPIPTPSVSLNDPVSVVMRFNSSTNIKRDASNYTDIESEIANITGISMERISILTVNRQEPSEIVVTANILDLNSTEFIILNDLIRSGNVSITFQGMVYFSLSIMLQPQPECDEYTGRNYDCSALSEVMPCPRHMTCQYISSRIQLPQFCVPCRCNLIPDNTTCNDNCINNVCIPIPSSIMTTIIPTTPTITSPSSDGLSGRAIAGIVVGVTLPLVLLCFLVLYFIFRRQIRNRGRFSPKTISMKKADTYQGTRKRSVPLQWDSTIYRNTNEMFTFSQQLAEKDSNDGDEIKEYSMFTDL